MSYDMSWSMPGPELDRQKLEAAIQKALSEFPGVVRDSGVDEDLAEFAEDFAADETEEDGFTFFLGLPEAMVRELAEGPVGGEPDDDGLYWGEVSVLPASEDVPAGLMMHSGASDNRECWMALGEVVGRIAELLGATPSEG
jgi:hypothetical protein